MDNLISKNNTDTIMACRYCPMCRHVCSSALLSFKESDTPRGRAILLYNVYQGEKPYYADSIESIYNCFLCGCCISWCQGYEEGGYNIPDLIKFSRRDIVRQQLEPEKVKKLKRSLLANENIYGIKKHKSFTSGICESEAGILYYLGQEVNFTNQEIARAIISIFDKLGLNYTVLKDEPESGKILSLLGYDDEAKNKATELYKRIKKTGCKVIVTSDPLAYDALKNDYPGYGLEIERGIKVKHLSEFLYDLAKEGKLKLKGVRKKVTIVDSEYFGRFNDSFETPRLLFKLIPGLELKEMQFHKEEMLATGESAFYYNNDNIDIGKKLGEKICKMAQDIKANIVITLSASAKNNIKRASNNSFEVLDIAEFIEKLI